MIGNDIVDLKHIAITSNWQRPRFADKVFTKKEQVLIFSSENQHQTVWLLWSMKEAAYKIHVQQHERRFFNPKRLECEFFSKDKGIVRIDREIYFTSSTITKDYIYTIAKLSKGNNVNSSVYKTANSSYRTQSVKLKQHILQSISKHRGLDILDLNIKKSQEGIPRLFNKSEELHIAFSLTHCGKYCGYSILNS